MISSGLPLRHAGSFGFDFGATEWFHDRSRDRYAIRIAVPDLPTALWDEVAEAVARWWSAHEGPGLPTRSFSANPSARYSLQGSS